MSKRAVVLCLYEYYDPKQSEGQDCETYLLEALRIVIALHGISPVDYLVLCSGERQSAASSVKELVEKILKERNVTPQLYFTEGENWTFGFREALLRLERADLLPTRLVSPDVKLHVICDAYRAFETRTAIATIWGALRGQSLRYEVLRIPRTVSNSWQLWLKDLRAAWSYISGGPRKIERDLGQS